MLSRVELRRASDNSVEIALVARLSSRELLHSSACVCPPAAAEIDCGSFEDVAVLLCHLL